MSFGLVVPKISIFKSMAKFRNVIILIHINKLKQ
jgi:hypothetical protein